MQNTIQQRKRSKSGTILQDTVFHSERGRAHQPFVSGGAKTLYPEQNRIINFPVLKFEPFLWWSAAGFQSELQAWECAKTLAHNLCQLPENPELNLKDDAKLGNILAELFRVYHSFYPIHGLYWIEEMKTLRVFQRVKSLDTVHLLFVKPVLECRDKLRKPLRTLLLTFFKQTPMEAFFDEGGFSDWYIEYMTECYDNDEMCPDNKVWFEGFLEDIRFMQEYRTKKLFGYYLKRFKPVNPLEQKLVDALSLYNSYSTEDLMMLLNYSEYSEYSDYWCEPKDFTMANIQMRNYHQFCSLFHVAHSDDDDCYSDFILEDVNNRSNEMQMIDQLYQFTDITPDGIVTPDFNLDNLERLSDSILLLNNLFVELKKSCDEQ